MTKAELVKQIASKAGITQVRAGKVLETLLESLSEVMIKGDSITLGGFGTFKTSHHKERAGRNPSTGDKLVIPARNMPRFAPGKELRDLVKSVKKSRKKKA